MAVNNSAGIFDWGPTGRSVEVDASGQLITTNEPVGGLYPLGYGKTGRALCVDGSGRLCITGVTTTSSGGSGSGVVDSAVATALSGRIYTGQDYELITDLGENVYSVENMNDRIFVGARGNGNLYEMSTSGWNRIAVVPDATRVNALKAWRGNLYVGALHDAEIYRLDGHNLTYITKASGVAGRINNFGEYDDKLIYVVEANYGTDANNRIYPVFYYDGSTSGILTKTRTNVPSWGWQFAPIALDHELYVYAANEQYLHRFDGINYDFYSDSDLAGVIWSRVFKGRLYGFGTNGVITFDKSTKDNRVEFYSGNAMTAQTNSAIVYRGRMYACDSAGDIYQTDGTGEWTYDGTIGKSVAGLAIASGSLYVVALNGEVYKRTAALVESLDNDLDACSHQSRSKFAYDFYNASGVFQKHIMNDIPSGTLSLDWGLGQTKELLLGEGPNNITLSNPLDGGKYTLILHQDDIGSRTVNWPDSIKWRGGSAPTLTATASGIDIVSMIYSDSYSSYYADASLDFS